jgi:hypothetical protein
MVISLSFGLTDKAYREMERNTTVGRKGEPQAPSFPPSAELLFVALV